jgi:hypothetical protein
MKIIITEEQNEQLNHKIRLTIEKLGLTQARELFGDNIIRQTYINNPSSYLNQFNKLKAIEKDDKIYYVDNDNTPIFFYFKQSELNKHGYYYINNEKIWSFFYKIMGYDEKVTKTIIHDWLKNEYNLSNLNLKTSILSDFDFEPLD